MDVQTAALETDRVIKHHTGVDAYRSEDGTGPGHARWMLKGIIDGYIQHEKAHRWLGYAQAIAIAEGCTTLGELKSTNKQA